MNKYLTVGTNNISKDLFRSVVDDGIKPRGGLWLTVYKYNNFNEWVDYLLMQRYLLFYKSCGNNPFNQLCSVVTLKDNANIYLLNSRNDLKYLFYNYPYYDNFSYNELSKYYDGIYVNLVKFLLCGDDYSNDLVKAFGVSSLILFNLDCIDYYQSGNIMIEPFDYEDNSFFDYSYDINYDSVKKKILGR